MSSYTEGPSQSGSGVVSCSHNDRNTTVCDQLYRRDQPSTFDFVSWSPEDRNTRSSDEDGGDMFLKKHRLIFNGLHGVIFHKIVVFITIAWRTSNATWKYHGLRVDVTRALARVVLISYRVSLNTDIEHICESWWF
jgi:hypothetical protein